MANLYRLLLSLLLGFPLAASSLDAQYVRVTSERVNVRTAPSTSSTVVVQALRGDVFELRGRSGDWHQINMFSGEWRYLHSSLATPTSQVAPMPSSEDVRRRAFVDLVRAQDRAVAESERPYPRDVMSQIELERILYDRYELPVFHRYGIQPPHRGTLVAEGIRKNWLPR